MMKLGADIAIEIEAADFMEAAAHQQRLQALLDDIRATYPQARLLLKERRSPRARPLKTDRRGGRAIAREDHRRAQALQDSP